MSTLTQSTPPSNKLYPTTDGKPMAETDFHRKLMTEAIGVLDHHFADEPTTYVSGNLLIFYVPGNKRRHLSPDVFVVRGVPKVDRLNYLTWEEGKGPDIVIEITSSTTRDDDLHKKFDLYQDVLKVPEYFLFDPLGDYLDPALQGYRLKDGEYEPIEMVDGGLMSDVLEVQLVRQGQQLRFFDPATGEFLLSADAAKAKKAVATATEAKTEAVDANARASKAEAESVTANAKASEAKAEAAGAKAEAAEAKAQVHEEKAKAREASARADAEIERLRRELERLRGEDKS